MQPGGVYQMDQSGYVQSYLPAYQNKSQNTAPARVKTQPQQPEPVEGEYWKSPTERVVPTQQPAPAQQQTPAPAAQPQQQNWGAFGMRGQSPEEINAWNNQVAQKQGPQNQVAQKQTIVPSGGMENVNKNLSVVQQQPQQVPTQRTAIMPGSMPQVMNQVQNQYGNDQIEWMGIQPPPKNLGKGLQNTINDILTLGKRS
jgi:hypothetical protein